MVVIGGGDDDAIELFLLDHLAEIGVADRFGIIRAALVQDLSIHVAQRRDVFAQAAKGFGIYAAHAGQTDDAEIQFLVGRVAARQSGGKNQHCLKRPAAGDGFPIERQTITPHRAGQSVL